MNIDEQTSCCASCNYTFRLMLWVLVTGTEAFKLICELPTASWLNLCWRMVPWLSAITRECKTEDNLWRACSCSNCCYKLLLAQHHETAFACKVHLSWGNLTPAPQVHSFSNMAASLKSGRHLEARFACIWPAIQKGDEFQAWNCTYVMCYRDTKDSW